mmetsp:Transcript_2690/g.3892  ORF Transcript_2690/g.3892 Transcript_2690/m.3892 type:complete len:124 (+) Transcript_2690:35-406(+)
MMKFDKWHNNIMKQLLELSKNWRRKGMHILTFVHTSALQRNLTVSAQTEGVVALPSSLARWTILWIGKTSGSLTSRCKSTHLTVLVNWVNDPVDTRIMTDRIVMRVDKNYFEILVSSILIDPI